MNAERAGQTSPAFFSFFEIPTLTFAERGGNPFSNKKSRPRINAKHLLKTNSCSFAKFAADFDRDPFTSKRR
jgi:hypothetical protein